MFKRTQFTTISPLPSSMTGESVMKILHNHEQMIDLNPIAVGRHPIAPSHSASTDELPFQWYRIQDGMQGCYAKYDAGFRNLDDGLQTRTYAPLGLKIDGKWTLCRGLRGDFEGKAVEEVVDDETKPEKGLWLREDVDMECNIFLTWFVKRTMKKSHAALVQRLIAKAEK